MIVLSPFDIGTECSPRRLFDPIVRKIILEGDPVLLFEQLPQVGVIDEKFPAQLPQADVFGIMFLNFPLHCLQHAVSGPLTKLRDIIGIL